MNPPSEPITWPVTQAASAEHSHAISRAAKPHAQAFVFLPQDEP